METYSFITYRLYESSLLEENILIQVCGEDWLTGLCTEFGLLHKLYYAMQCNAITAKCKIENI